MLGEGDCGCLQVAGVGFNGLIFPQIDLGKIGWRGEGGERSRAGSNGLIYLPHNERFQLRLQSCMKE